MKKNLTRTDDPEMHRQLSDLPTLKAPDNLIPNVMSVIRQRQQAWYRRPATNWSPAVQLAVVAAALCLMAGLVWAFGDMLPDARTWNPRNLIEAPLSRLAALTATLETLINAGAVIGRTTIGPALLILTAAASLFYLGLFGMGTALWRNLSRVSN